MLAKTLMNTRSMSEKPHKPAQAEEVIIGIAVGIAFALTQFPYKKINGSTVPTIIFKDSPHSFHAFILALNFAFFGSFVTINLRQIFPKIARCSLLLAVVSLALVVGIPLWLMLAAEFLSPSLLYMPRSF
ncbi:hypothetical protein TorRG33x02_340500 [Trema orientale]|uniref:Uncharacterized protein n=1 Tax=Trema orientale TaxID=63057 RepID=A0A2P5AV49_TREOI|nr:hypothetical protein TorRG33x02_340500 [Trema orientale]